MNCKKTIPFLLILFHSAFLFCQKVEFTYDENGNRISRSIITQQLESASISFPVLNTKTLKSVESVKTVETDQLIEGEIKANVYPNPNKGLIKIDVSNMPLNAVNELRLYDLNGTELIVKRNFESYYEIDISQYKDGIYVLRLKINERLFDWKIIKN